MNLHQNKIEAIARHLDSENLDLSQFFEGNNEQVAEQLYEGGYISYLHWGGEGENIFVKKMYLDLEALN